MLKIGLTGNIGSGKSLVAKIFETLHIPVFYADVEAKKNLNSPETIAKIKALFGTEIIHRNTIDRTALAQIVFSDISLLNQLNAIIHPAVRQKFDHWAACQSNTPAVIYEAAILHESGHYNNMDKIILVTANENIRIKRVMQRDGVSREMVRQRMANQWPENEKTALSDFVINNNETTLLIPQVIKIWEAVKGEVRSEK